MKRIWQLVLSMSQVFIFLCFLILIAQRCSSDCHLWLLSLRNSPGPSFCLWLLRPGSIFYKSSLLFFNIFNPLRAIISSLTTSWISSPRSKSTAGRRLGWTCYSLDSRWPRWVEHVDHIWPRWPSCTFWSCWQNWLRSHQVGLWLTVDGLIDQAKRYHSQGQHLRQA